MVKTRNANFSFVYHFSGILRSCIKLIYLESLKNRLSLLDETSYWWPRVLRTPDRAAGISTTLEIITICRKTSRDNSSRRSHALISNPRFRYDMMVDEEELFREWNRPHNERLYKLLDRDLMWR